MTQGTLSGNSGRHKDELGRDILEVYFTTAQIDAGNSGGLAVKKLAEDSPNSAYGVQRQGTICQIGIPTWVSKGEYMNVGLIQNY